MKLLALSVAVCCKLSLGIATVAKSATFSAWTLAGFSQQIPVLVRAFSKICCKNRGLGRCGVSVRLCGRCGGNTWSVNFRTFFLLKKKLVFPKFTGPWAF